MPKLPHSLSLVKKMRSKIAPHIQGAPLVASPKLKEKIGTSVNLKIESLQLGGSFKIRGALAFLEGLKEGGYSDGIVTASNGNYGRAVAIAAKLLDFKCQVFMPQTNDKKLMEELESLGAEVVALGFSLDESFNHAQEFCEAQNLHYVPRGDNPMSLAGIASSATEVLEHYRENKIGTVVLPIGSGALANAIGGTLKEAQPNLHVVGIQNEKICGGPPTQNTGEQLDAIVDEVIQISSKAVEEAMAFLFHEHHIVVEEAGALAVAALLEDEVNIHSRHVLAYVTGGNLSHELFDKILTKDY